MSCQLKSRGLMEIQKTSITWLKVHRSHMFMASLGPRPNGRSCGWITSLTRSGDENHLQLRPLGLGLRLGYAHTTVFRLVRQSFRIFRMD